MNAFMSHTPPPRAATMVRLRTRKGRYKNAALRLLDGCA
jgi:hypothetical protein